MNSVTKKYLIYGLDALFLLIGSVVVLSGYVVWFPLQRGIGLHGESNHCSGGGIGSVGNPVAFLGWVRYNWIDFHKWAAIALLAMAVIHVILHWNWILVTTGKFIGHLHEPPRKVLELYGTFAVLSFLFLFECVSGLVLWVVMPRGVRDFYFMKQGIGRTFLGLERIVWVDLHSWVAVTIVSIIVVHLILNWEWVAGTTKKILKAPKPVFADMKLIGKRLISSGG